MPRTIYDPTGSGYLPPGGVVQNTNQRATQQAATLQNTTTAPRGTSIGDPAPQIQDQYAFINTPGGTIGYDKANIDQGNPIYGSTDSQGQRQMLGFNQRNAPSLGDTINASEQQVRDYYNGLMRSGNSVNPADIERDMQTVRQNSIAQYQAEQMAKQQAQQKAGMNAVSSAAAGLPPVTAGDINKNTMPGTLQQRAAARGDLRNQQNGTPQPQVPTPQAAGSTTAPGTASSGAPVPGVQTAQTQEQYNQSEFGGTTPQSSAAPSSSTTPQSTTPQSSLDLALSSISSTPEGALIIAGMNDYKKEIQTLQTQNQQNTNALLNGGTINGQPVQGINQAFATMDANNKAQEGLYTQTANSLQGLIDSVKNQNEKYLQEERKAQEDRLAWDTAKQTRELKKQETQGHQAMIAQLALNGGFGQDAGLAAVAASDATFEQKISDVQNEMGVQRTELSAKFSGLYLQNQNDYVNQSKANIKELRDGLISVKEKENSSTQAKATAEQTLLSKAWDNETSLRKGLADANLSLADKLTGFITDKRKMDQQDQIHEDAVNARNQAHTDAMTQHGDTVYLQQEGLYNGKGMTLRKQFTDDINKDAAITPYDEFNNNIYSRFQALTKDGTLTASNPETAVMLTDLFANANNPKLTARMPTQVVDLFNSNLSPADKAKNFINNFMGKGTMDQQMLNGMTNALNDIHTKLQENAQNALDLYAVKAIHENSLFPEGFKHLGIDPSTLMHGDLNMKTPLGNTDQGKQPDYESIYNGSSLTSYTSQSGFRVTQGFNGIYDQKFGATGTHGAYDIAPPSPGQTPPIPAYTNGVVSDVGSTGPYGKHFYVTDANGVKWLYGHLNSLDVKNGDQIAKGQTVGIMGDTGNADGVHLHLEAYKDGKPYDFANDPNYI